MGSVSPPGSRTRIPKHSGQESLPGEEDEGRCLMRPSHPPGVALSLAPGAGVGYTFCNPEKARWVDLFLHPVPLL